jgi:hypothetical protein
LRSAHAGERAKDGVDRRGAYWRGRRAGPDGREEQTECDQQSARHIGFGAVRWLKVGGQQSWS